MSAQQPGLRCSAFGRAAFAVTLLALSTRLLAESQALTEPRSFDIPAQQTLEKAILAFSSQAKVQVLLWADPPASRTSAGATGELYPLDALKAILSNSGLTWQQIDPETVAIVYPDRQAHGPQPAIRVAQAGPNVSHAADLAVGPSSSDSVALAEIVVTATHREESAEKVPISIAAISGQDLAANGIKDISDVSARTPGLQFAVPNAFAATVTTVAIRGLNTENGASVVGIYLDDIPIQARLEAVGAVGSAYPVAFDLDRVEVERGPQGTLFGAGSEAGALRFITNQPSLTTFSGFAHTEVAATDRGAPSWEVGAAAGGPIIQDELGFRVSVWDRRDGGYVDRADPITGDIVAKNSNSDEKLLLRGALAFEMADSVKITASLNYQQTRSNDSSRFYNLFSDPSQGQLVNAFSLPESWNEYLTLPSLKAETALPFADLTVVASYENRDVQLHNDVGWIFGPILFPGGFGNPLSPALPVSPADAGPSYVGQTVRAFTEEVRLTSNQKDAFFTWVAGIFNDHRTQVDFNYISLRAFDPTGADIFGVNQPITDTQTAVFAQGDFHLSPQWTITGGIRVARVVSNQIDFNGTGALNAGEPAVSYSNIRETPNTPRVSVSYQMDDKNLFYAAASKGFRVGGGNAPLPDNCSQNAPGYKSDYVWSYEIGAKNKLFNDRVQLDTSAFYIDWDKIQTLVVAPCGVAYTANAGSAVSKGFDLALQALITNQLRAELDIGYVDAYFTTSVLDPFGNPLVQKGDKVAALPQVNPPWDVRAALNYETRIPGANNQLHVHGEYQYHSRNPGPFISTNAQSSNYAPLETADPPLHLVNARMGVNLSRVNLDLFVNNMFNSHPALGAFQLPATSNLVTYSTFRPRTVGLAVNYEF